jgi:hypothetical protein
MQLMTDLAPGRLTTDQLVRREHLHRVRSTGRASARAARAMLAADLVRLDRWAQSHEVWTSRSQSPAT